MTKLNALQQLELDKLARVSGEYKSIRFEMERRIREAHLNAQEELQTRIDNLVVECIESGIPKRQVGLYGLLTSNPYAVYNAIERAEAKNHD